jgi:hypothetical protein
VPPVPGRAPETANRTPLIVVGVAVIAVCVVVLFALGGGGPASTPLQAGDCVPAESDGVVPCDDADAAYRVVELREDVLAAAAPAACAEVPGVVAYGWQGAEDRPGTALCLGPA